MSSSSTVTLPAYSEHPNSRQGPAPSIQTIASGIAGNIQTCSIKDLQYDYLEIVRESATSYYICLSVDPTPIYRVKFISASKLGDVQIFLASGTKQHPVAAARLSDEPQNKKGSIAMICISEPYLPDASWHPLLRLSFFFGGIRTEEYSSSIPIVAVPGKAPSMLQFKWDVCLSGEEIKLWWEGGPTPPFTASWLNKDEHRGKAHLFATVVQKKTVGEANLIEIRRGGGLEFELSVILQIFVILQRQSIPFR